MTAHAGQNVEQGKYSSTAGGSIILEINMMASQKNENHSPQRSG